MLLCGFHPGTVLLGAGVSTIVRSFSPSVIVMNIVFTAFKPSAPPRVQPKAAIP